MSVKGPRSSSEPVAASLSQVDQTRASRYLATVRVGLLIGLLASVAHGQSITEFPIPTPDAAPFNIVAGPDGALWFTESSGNRIGRITTAGIITEFTLPTPGSSPYGIAAGPDGALWFTESSGNRIGRITTAGFVTEFSLSTDSSFPLGIVAGADGALWFTEHFANKIGRITTAGVITEFTVPTASSEPLSIAAAVDGALWFTEKSGNKIGRITTAGIITEFPVPTPGSEPYDIACGSGSFGVLCWFTELSGGKIGRIMTSGVIDEIDLSAVIGTRLTGITVGPNDTAWFAEANNNVLGGIFMARNSRTGITQPFLTATTAVPTPSAGPYGLAIGPEGALWFTEHFGNKIGRFTIGSGGEPSLTVSISGPSTGTTFAPLTFTAHPSGGTGPYTFGWTCDFHPGFPIYGGLSSTQTCIYTVPRTLAVMARVTDSVGAVADAGMVVTITALPAPSAEFTITGATRDPLNGNYTGTTGVPITFTAIETNANSYAWGFGDGTSAAGRAFTKFYSSPGTFVARLTVSGNGVQTAGASTSSVILGIVGPCVPSLASRCIALSSPRSRRPVAHAVYPSVTYSVTTSTSGTGSGTVAASPSGPSYASGTVVTLTATPYAGSTFAAWSGDCSGMSSTCTLTMNSNKSATATFNTQTYTLSTSTAGTGTGVISPAGGSYASGTVVTLTATPNTGSAFSGWSGACTGAARTCAVTMNGNKTVTATFDTDPVVFPPGTCNNGQACSAVTIVTRTLPTATAGVSYSYQLQAFGGTPPYTWAASTIYPGYFSAPTTPPNGLALNTSTGVISGTPLFSGAFPLLVSLRDSTVISGYNTNVQMEFVVSGAGSPYSITNTPPNGTQGSAYDFTFNTSWAPAILGCSRGLQQMIGLWPAGLDANSLSGRLAGTPIFAGAYTFTFSADGGSSGCLTPANARTFTVQINPAASPATPPGSSNWTRGSTNPVLRPSVSGWDSFALGNPTILKVGATYFLYYEGEDYATHTKRIGVATSTDGVNWTKSLQNPVLQPGAPGTWDSFSVRSPVVHYDGVIYRMWYRGWNGSASNLGLAISQDGVNFTRYGGNPLAGWPKLFGSSAMLPGSVVFTASQFMIWYWDGLGSIGLATSPDGFSWIDRGYVGGLASVSKNGRPWVIKDGETLRIWYESLDGFVSGFAQEGLDIYNARIRYGFSTDPNGKVWSMVTDASSDTYSSVLVLGAANAWDRPGVGQPTVLKDGATFKMWYVGGPMKVPYSPVEGAIGFAFIP